MASFQELGLAERCSDLLQTMGIRQPTPIQEQTIPIVMKGRDVIGQAQTGTGKTLAFVLPILERIDPASDRLQGLIVTPTRELALQITAEVKKLVDAYEGVRVLAVYGGQDVEAQLKKLQGNVHLIIATPGRLLDHVRRETVRLSEVRMLVLDEADQMLHMGFLGEVEDILRNTPADRQTMLFSATMPEKIRDLAARFLRQPEEVTVRAKQVTVKDTRQLVIETTDRGKQAALVRMLEETRPYLAVIFCRTKRRASTLNEALQRLSFSCDELHGDLSQAKREQVMKQFREAKLQLLVATDIAARGIDVEGVTHVFNYDVPQDVESYIHRIGRTGRAGGAGMAITFIAPRDRAELAQIENGIGMGIERSASVTGASDAAAAPAGAGRSGGRTPGAFGNKLRAQARGGRGSGERQERGARSGGERKERGARSGGERQERGVRSGGERQERGARSGGERQERGARGGGERQERGARSGGERQERGARSGKQPARGEGGRAGPGRGKPEAARAGRAPEAGGAGGMGPSTEQARWWEKGKYFTPEPTADEGVDGRAPAAKGRRPGAGGPGNGRRDAGAAAQTAGRSGGRFGGGAERSGKSADRNAGAGERGGRGFGSAAERGAKGERSGDYRPGGDGRTPGSDRRPGRGFEGRSAGGRSMNSTGGGGGRGTSGGGFGGKPSGGPKGGGKSPIRSQRSRGR